MGGGGEVNERFLAEVEQQKTKTKQKMFFCPFCCVPVVIVIPIFLFKFFSARNLGLNS